MTVWIVIVNLLSALLLTKPVVQQVKIVLATRDKDSNLTKAFSIHGICCLLIALLNNVFIIIGEEVWFLISSLLLLIVAIISFLTYSGSKFKSREIPDIKRML